MTDRITLNRLDLAGGERCFHIAMQAPRANALEPALLKDLHHAFDALEASDCQKALITGGRNFSSGGDVHQFLMAAKSQRAEAYADQVVPLLQALVMRMIDMPILLASAVRGAATGGAAGIVFASDLVALSPDAFVQPYYGVMGFAPDGGWTATLPLLIGLAPARSWLLANQRQCANDLVRLGLAQGMADDPQALALCLLDAVETGTALAAKSMLWNDTCRGHVQTALEQESIAFRTLISRRETQRRMETFCKQQGGSDV